jgi:hypothetical protein
MKKHKYDIGDIVKVSYSNKQEKIGIILNRTTIKTPQKHNTYEILLSGIPEYAQWFYEYLIVEKI